MIGVVATATALALAGTVSAGATAPGSPATATAAATVVAGFGTQPFGTSTFGFDEPRAGVPGVVATATSDAQPGTVLAGGAALLTGAVATATAAAEAGWAGIPGLVAGATATAAGTSVPGVAIIRVEGTQAEATAAGWPGTATSTTDAVIVGAPATATAESLPGVLEAVHTGTQLYPSPNLYPTPGLYPGAPALFLAARIGHEWTAFSRTPVYALNLLLPIMSAQIVARHMGVSRAVVTTPFTPERYQSLDAGSGVVIHRDGEQQFSGMVSELAMDWDAESGRAVIRASCVGDEQHLADRIVCPDPLRAADDQTVNDYWQTRAFGQPTAVPASTAMRQLISDQAGLTAAMDRQVPGLTLGPDPYVGVSRVWSALFTPVLDELAAMSVVSGADLGIRVESVSGALAGEPGQLVAHITAPRNVSADVRFSADLRNLAGISYRTTAPTATHALSAGAGDLKARLRKLATSADPDALSWGRQVWKYLDRRDTADTVELTKAAADAITEGAPTVSLSTTLLDSEAATYGRDWGLGDKVTVYVGLPGQTKVATVTDLVREILFEVDADGRERIRPAIGTADATAVQPTQTQQQLAAVGRGLTGLIARK